MISSNSYEEIKPLDKASRVWLVKDNTTNLFMVRKRIEIFDISVYDYLKLHKPQGIPQIYDYLVTEEGLTVFEEYIPGRTLKEILQEEGPFQEEKAVEMLQVICGILIPLHSQNPAIVHRDIKPSNIVIRNDDQIYLIDFNAATKFSDSKDRDTVLIGTTGYAAPEQYGFKASGPAADIYALGRVAQELFTGEKTAPEKYSGPYKELIQKSLKLDPEDRYGDASELQKALSVAARKKAPLHRWYIPPGYRSGKPWIMVLATFGYIIALIMFTPFPNGEGVIKEASDVFTLFFLLSEFLFAANYMNIHSKLPFTSSPKIAVRLVGVLAYMVVIYLFFIIMATILGEFGIL